MSKIVAVVLLLLEACDALLVTPHSSHALLRTDGRCSAPLLLASKRKKRGKKSERSGASRPEAPQQYAPPDSPPPRAAAPVPSVPPPQWEPPPTPLVATPGSFSDAAPPAAEEVQPLPLPAVDDYLVSQVRDEPKQALPSFDSYSRGAPKKPPPPAFSGQYESKLPSINQGAAYQPPAKEEKPLFEKLIFRGTWAGIIILVAIEIFINTPAFQSVKPAILRFLGSD